MSLVLTFSPVSPGSMPINLLADHFSSLDDFREEANLHDPLTNVSLIAVAAAIRHVLSSRDADDSVLLEGPVVQG